MIEDKSLKALIIVVAIVFIIIVGTIIGVNIIIGNGILRQQKEIEYGNMNII